MSSSSTSALAEQALQTWETNAQCWDDTMKDSGNDYYRFLELPALERMVVPRSGEKALDLATGNGLVARWLVEHRLDVLATDGSHDMVQYAQARTLSWAQSRGTAVTGQVSFEQLDLVDNEQVSTYISRLLEVQPDGFDVIVINMAIMDLPDLSPLADIVAKLLKPYTGRFVATLLHPLFFTSGASRNIAVSEDEEGNRIVERSIVLSQYLNVPPRRIAPFRQDQPVKQIAFHRPLHELLAPFFAVGLVMDKLEEPNFDQRFVDESRPHASKNYTQIPKILAFRLRSLRTVVG